MPLAEARALSQAHCEQHDALADTSALVELAGWCEQFSPTVGLAPPDNLCLDITGIGQLFGGEHSLVQQVVRAFSGRKLTCRMAVAETLGGAWALAHYGREISLVPPGRSVDALAELPVSGLRLSPADVSILAELGIVRIGQLLPLPRDLLASRFPIELLRRLDQALGMVPEPIVSHRPPPEIVVESKLEYPVHDRLTIEVIVEQLITRISQQLQERQAGAIQMECELCCDEGATVKLLIGLWRASAHTKHLLELMRLRLERLALPAPVIGIRFSVLISARLTPCQQELFEPSGREAHRQVGLLVDRLSNRLGRDAVARAVPQDDAQPECAVRYEPLAGVPPRKSKPQRYKPLPRPIRIEPRPRALKTVAVVPEGPPIRFEFCGSHTVAHVRGPERIQTAWWRGGYVQRDYYRVQTTTGKQFWLFRRLTDRKWFLQGIFD